MGRRPGVQNIPKDAAQLQVLELLSQGSTVVDAMKAVGRNDVTFRQWSMADPEFKDKADKARLSGKGIKADLANLKDISFEDFSEQFLETRLFDHHKSWIDLVEGKEPVQMNTTVRSVQLSLAIMLVLGVTTVNAQNNHF